MTARPPRPTGFTSRLAACIEAYLRLKEAQHFHIYWYLPYRMQVGLRCSR